MFYSNKILQKCLLNKKDIFIKAEDYGFEISDVSIKGFNVYIPFNRQDCNSIYGFSRQACTWYNQKFNFLISKQDAESCCVNSKNIQDILLKIYGLKVENNKLVSIHKEQKETYINAANFLKKNYSKQVIVPEIRERSKIIILDLNRFKKVTGQNLKEKDIINYLNQASLKAYKYKSEYLKVSVPFYLSYYLKDESTLYGEILKRHGYSNIRLKMPYINYIQAEDDTPASHIKLADLGFNEVKSISLVSGENKLKIKNPEQGYRYLRSNLIDQLIKKYLQYKDVRIFEQGTCFVYKNNKIQEIEKVAGIASGYIRQESWYKLDKINIYYVLGDLQKAGYIPEEYYTKKSKFINSCVDIYSLKNDQYIGFIGLHKDKAVIFELELIDYRENKPKIKSFQAKIDVSIKLNACAGDVTKHIYAIDIKDLVQAIIVDNFKKGSFTIRLYVKDKTKIQKVEQEFRKKILDVIKKA